MSTILLSFVGKQDPYSPKNNEDGSILTIVKHLANSEQATVKAILIHTQGTLAEAELTAELLRDNYSVLEVKLIRVSEKLSDDPVNLTLAIEEAKKALNIAEKWVKEGDLLALNGSSGTPVMKSTWNILQGAGYAPHSKVWQVRNPDTIKPGQPHVFTTNVEVLKQEFDFQVVLKQLDNYNYNGALFSLEESSLLTKKVRALLIYGRERFAFNFDTASSQINTFTDSEDIKDLKTDIGNLYRKNACSLLKEVYFKAHIKLKQQQYSDFLIWLFAFQENLLQYLIKRKFLPKTEWNTNWKQVDRKIIEEIKVFDNGKLYQQLLENENRSFDYLNRPMMLKIIEYDQDFSHLLDDINCIDKYASRRNSYIHNLEGIKNIEGSKKILKAMTNILKLITKLPGENPFDSINRLIIKQLKSQLNGNIIE